MNDNDLCRWLRASSSGTYRPSAEAADRIEALNIELAELKASIPQIKHDAIVEAISATFYLACVDFSEECSVWGLTNCAKDILTQAKEAAE